MDISQHNINFNGLQFTPVKYHEGRAVLSNDSVSLLTAKLFTSIKGDNVQEFDYYIEELKRLSIDLDLYKNKSHSFVTKAGKTLTYTLLEFACISHSISCVKRLLSMGVSIDTQDTSLNSPLHLVAKTDGFDAENQRKIIKLLLKSGANPKVSNADGEVPMDFELVQTARPLMQRLFNVGGF